MTWHPSGVLSLVQADALVNWIEAVEPVIGTFNRFADLSRLNEIHLSDDDIATLAEKRSGSYRGEPVKVVLLAGTLLSYGIAAMYQRLMSATPIQVEVVVQLTSACRILGVGPELLIRQP
ncbi:MAG TPA: hypothetical protein VFD27_07775 [Chthoniobacteraceae bacterium]|nr:hypothetical protein [Chthoniobacteraceae bacterium]